MVFRIASGHVNSTAPPRAPARKPGKSFAIARLILVPLLVVIGVIVAWRMGYFQMDKRQHLAELAIRFHALPWSEVVFVSVYAIAIAVLLPASVVTTLGGAVFGSWEGAVLAWLGALVGTCLTHVLARRVMRGPIQRVFGEHKLLRRLRERGDLTALFRLRILPIAPFATLDYVAGIAGVSLPRLLIVTMVGVIPSVVAYSYVGAAIIQGMLPGAHDSSHRALWIAGGVTAAMLLISGIPMLLHRGRE